FAFDRLSPASAHHLTVHRALSASLDANLDFVAARCHLDISGPQLEPIVEPRRDDRAVEHELRKTLAPFAAHADDHPIRAAPDTVAGRPETAGQQLADLLGRHGRLYDDRP